MAPSVQSVYRQDDTDKQQQQQHNVIDCNDISIAELANAEIEKLRSCTTRRYHAFPRYCMSLLRTIPGNHRCVDCGSATNPQWAAVKYGALLCLHCSGFHRSLGVRISSVRSIVMDEWSVEEIVSLVEGGNDQLRNFFARHALTETSINEHDNNPTTPTTASNSMLTRDNVSRLRYKTKAALFYRKQMQIHVQQVLEDGVYMGRDHSRRRVSPTRRNSASE